MFYWYKLELQEMNTYQFKKYKDINNKFDLSYVTVDVETVSLRDLIHEFECFLKACDFYFTGHLQFVEGEEVNGN